MEDEAHAAERQVSLDPPYFRRRRKWEGGSLQG